MSDNLSLQRVRGIGRAALGRRSDWLPARPRVLRRSRAWVGPLAIIATTSIGWFAFAGAGGTVALGLFVGAASIVLMAWSFVLAVRIRPLEPIFGGLDRMYQAHRWAGALAVPLMFLHVQVEPEVDGGIPGAARSVAESAEGLAGVAELMIYGLVAISLIRWLPYRFWRWTHKLLGVPFAFASWHFFTAEKTYANSSRWGWYFGIIMIVGLAAYLWRVAVRDMIRRGHRYRVRSTNQIGSTLELVLEPTGRSIRHRVGQFAVLKIQERGLSEPHPFTIASAPESGELRFFIRDLGDWSGRLQDASIAGTTVFVEGPYGEFEPLPPTPGPVLWVAGGVGITPFLAAIDRLGPAPADRRPVLVYCVRTREDATAIVELEQADADGRIDLRVVESARQGRFQASQLAAMYPTLQDTHVAVCGPAGLVSSVERAARRLGARHVESEAFDIRSGLGPDLSVPIADLVGSARTGNDRERRVSRTPVTN